MSKVENDSRVDAALVALGGQSRTFRPSALRVASGRIIAGAMTLGGLGLAVGMPVSGYSIWWLLAFVGALIGVGMLWYIGSIAATRIYLCPEGLIHSNRTSVTPCAWPQILKVVEQTRKSHLPLNGILGLIPVGSLTTYAIHRSDGISFTFDRETIKETEALARIVADQSKPRGVHWVVEEV